MQHWTTATIRLYAVLLSGSQGSWGMHAGEGKTTELLQVKRYVCRSFPPAQRHHPRHKQTSSPSSMMLTYVAILMKSVKRKIEQTKSKMTENDDKGGNTRKGAEG